MLCVREKTAKKYEINFCKSMGKQKDSINAEAWVFARGYTDIGLLFIYSLVISD